MLEWILSLIFLVAPANLSREQLLPVAAAIDVAVNEIDQEPEWDRFSESAKLVALAARESRFDPEAVGRDQFGESYGLFQVHESNLGKVLYCGTGSDGKGWACWPLLTAAQAFDPLTATRVARHMTYRSESICAHRPPEERLGWYASGGRGCDVPEGLSASRNRMALAAWLLRKIPPPVLWTSRSVDVLPRRTK